MIPPMRHKTCFKCGRSLPISQFYIHKQMKDGLLNKCKECARADVKRNRDSKVEYYRAYDRERSDRPRVRSYDPIQKAARDAVARAVRRGDMKPPENCAICGKRCRPDAHHDDYKRKLDVIWLCPVCHANRHAEQGKLGKHSPRKACEMPYKGKSRTLSEAIDIAENFEGETKYD